VARRRNSTRGRRPDLTWPGGQAGAPDLSR